MRSRILGLLVAGATLPFLAAQAHALTPAEVACEEAKLGRLIHRFSTFSFGSNLFLWGTGGDTFAGLAVSPPFPDGPFARVRDERQLAFDLALEAGGGLLNPHRPLLPQAILVRRDLETNLSATVPVMDMTLELAPDAVDPTEPRQGLFVAGRLGADFGSASGASRSLTAERLFVRCSAEGPSAFDLQVFEILSRTLRITDVLTLPFPGPGLDRYKTIFFRDVEPLTYRAKVYAYLTTEFGYGEGSFQLRLRLTLDGAGKLAAGRIETLPWCRDSAPPCTEFLTPGAAVIVGPPIFAGHERQTEAQFRSGAFLNLESEASPDNILADDVPWPELLRGTAWDRPLAPP